MEELKQAELLVVEAYRQALSNHLINFALMAPNDAHYIVIKYSGHIYALTDMEVRGIEWARKEARELTKIMEPPIRRFLSACANAQKSSPSLI